MIHCMAYGLKQYSVLDASAVVVVVMIMMMMVMIRLTIVRTIVNMIFPDNLPRRNSPF